MPAADLSKRFSQAHDTPSGYPVMGQVSAEAFHRAPIVAGEVASSPGYAGFVPDPQPAPVPSAAVSAAAVTRPLITDGRSRPGAGGEPS